MFIYCFLLLWKGSPLNPVILQNSAVLWILAGFYLSVFWPSRKSFKTEFEELVAVDFECPRECKLYGSIMLSLEIQNVAEQTFSKDSTSTFVVISRFGSSLSLSSSVGCVLGLLP